jgi:hypothetical protein
VYAFLDRLTPLSRQGYCISYVSINIVRIVLTTFVDREYSISYFPTLLKRPTPLRFNRIS